MACQAPDREARALAAATNALGVGTNAGMIETQPRFESLLPWCLGHEPRV